MSKRQLEANRRNALKSTGPRTPEGKARSSRNAITHGILAQEVLIRAGDGAEDPAELEALLEQFRNDLRPVGVLEEMLVERIAACYWRLRRAQRFEVGAIRERLDECNRRPEDPGTQELERDLLRAKAGAACAILFTAWVHQRKRLTFPDVCEALGGAWGEAARVYGVTDVEGFRSPLQIWLFMAKVGATKLTGKRLRARMLAVGRDIIKHVCGFVDKFAAKLDEARRYDGLAQERAALVHALPNEADINKLIRYETMINRQLDRAVYQLERLQRARQGDHVPAPVALDVNIAGVKEAG
jgi:hypothetical protein